MTKIELMRAIVEGATVTAEMAEKAAEIIAADEAAKEKRKGKVSEKDAAKRAANEEMAKHIAVDILGAEAKTATDVAEALTAELEDPAEPVKVQKASYLLRLAVTMGLAAQTEVKIPKKGTQKAYTAI